MLIRVVFETHLVSGLHRNFQSYYVLIKKKVWGPRVSFVRLGNFVVDLGQSKNNTKICVESPPQMLIKHVQPYSLEGVIKIVFPTSIPGKDTFISLGSCTQTHVK